MSRTSATALALVNWKGVFYERYLLDRHVTALEGANGAGKTTVMIAAYVVLLPDLLRLRFTNLGETAATGGDRGIYGRLGENGRPSYAAMELELTAGKRIVAGVRLVRKAEPTLELTPFIVSDLDLQGSLKDILLVSTSEHDEVPEIDDVRAAVERRGGTIRVFASAKDYFAALFELGVTPLRLATEEERSKLHDMLKTSMTGGISRALTSELRSFLLKEETGLSDTLVRMRDNLEACRRTRAEVADVRVLEHEIRGVHDAGQAMLVAVAAAAHAGWTESHSTLQNAEAELQRHSEARAALADAIGTMDARHARVNERLTELRLMQNEGRERRRRALVAREVATRMAALETKVVECSQRADGARAERDRASLARTERKIERDRARDALNRAARGLGDLQAGLDELHRRTHAQRHVRSRLEEARALLEEPGLAAPNLDDRLERVRTELAAVDLERSKLARDGALREAHRDEFAAAERCLVRLRSGLATPESSPVSLHDEARRELARLASLESIVSRREAMGAELVRVRAQAALAQDARERAASLGVVWEEASTPEKAASNDPAKAIAHAHSEAETTLRAREREELEARIEANESGSLAERSRAEAESLDAEVSRWGILMARARRLAGEGEPLPVSSDGISCIRTSLIDERERLRTAVTQSNGLRDELLRQAKELDDAIAAPEISSAREALSAELLSDRFEAVRLDDARWLEAALGPLANAWIVRDPGAAAEALAGCSQVPDTVWLVAEEDVARIVVEAERLVPSGEALDVVVQNGLALRVTRPAMHPTLGRDARSRRVRELRTEADALANTLAGMRDAISDIDERLRAADALLREMPLLMAGDPAVRAVAARRSEEQARAAEKSARERARVAEDGAKQARQRVDALRDLLPHSHLLASFDLDARAVDLGRTLADAEGASRELARTAEDRAWLAERLDVLRHPPADDGTILKSEGAMARLESGRDRLFAAERALTEVVAQKEALGWTDLDGSVDGNAALGATLEAQHAAAQKEAAVNEEALALAEAEWERATAVLQLADAERSSAVAHLKRIAKELEDAGGTDMLRVAVDELEGRLATGADELDALTSEERRLAIDKVVALERRVQNEAALKATATVVAEVRIVADLAATTWQAFERTVLAAGAAPAGLALEAGIAKSPTAPLATHHAEARAQRALLMDRLAQVRGGADAGAAVRNAFVGGDETPLEHFSAWLAVRTWALRRLPTQFADEPEPARALEKLRADLRSLEERIALHETELRGTSEDVARGIDVHLRKTSARVRRLNRDLTSIGFGSVAAVRVQIQRVERMDLVLRALRGGEVQELLFQPDLPFEDALAEVFRRYGGGGRAGAHKVLDYREYLELTVEIQRRSAPTWELASPTRLSTGEAIGVGAALMMVVLTEWERDANMLRSDRSTQTLRFLFLDEANRLSPDNLAVLFDLCRSLDLQLLIAAPEVARAQGNTTYRLVRRVDEAGREEVIVSGRRVTTEAPS